MKWCTLPVHKRVLGRSWELESVPDSPHTTTGAQRHNIVISKPFSMPMPNGVVATRIGIYRISIPRNTRMLFTPSNSGRKLETVSDSHPCTPRHPVEKDGYWKRFLIAIHHCLTRSCFPLIIRISLSDSPVGVRRSRPRHSQRLW